MTIAALVLATLLGGCASGDWETKDISGMLPALAFSLTDDQGAAVTAEDYRGKAVLLFFGYTSCPDVCPATLARLSGLLEQLPADERRDVRVLFVSVDPRRDDPQRLRSYTRHFGANFVGLTGTERQLRALAKRCRVTFGYGAPDANGAYSVSHSAVVLGFDPHGDARVLIRDKDDGDAVLADIRHLVGNRA